MSLPSRNLLSSSFFTTTTRLPAVNDCRVLIQASVSSSVLQLHLRRRDRNFLVDALLVTSFIYSSLLWALFPTLDQSFFTYGSFTPLNSHGDKVSSRSSSQVVVGFSASRLSGQIQPYGCVAIIAFQQFHAYAAETNLLQNRMLRIRCLKRHHTSISLTACVPWHTKQGMRRSF